MKTKILIPFLALAVFGWVQAAEAQQYQSGDYIITENSIGWTITEYIGSGGVVTIPNAINSLTVISIGNVNYGAFQHSSVTAIRRVGTPRCGVRTAQRAVPTQKKMSQTD